MAMAITFLFPLLLNSVLSGQVGTFSTTKFFDLNEGNLNDPPRFRHESTRFGYFCSAFDANSHLVTPTRSRWIMANRLAFTIASPCAGPAELPGASFSYSLD